jgi:phage I-like protein
MNLPILNRTLPADGWFHVVPQGEYPHPEHGVQVLDEKALVAMFNRFQPEVLIDQDHFSYDPDKSSEAMGWVKALEKRAGGLFAKIDFTDLGKAAVVNGRYRFISPVWLQQDTEPAGPGKIRPLRIDSFGLTNQPNLKGMVPLSNRQPNGGAGKASATSQGVEPMKDKLIAILGLAADAGETAIVEAVTTIKNRIPALETSVTDLRKNSDALKVERDALLEVQVDRDLDDHKDVIANRDQIKQDLIANRTGTLATLKALKAPAKPAVHNRSAAQPPTTKDGEELTAAERRGRAIRNRATELRKGTPTLTFEQAWQQASDEVAAAK